MAGHPVSRPLGIPLLAAVCAVLGSAPGCGEAPKPVAKPLPVATVWSSMPYKGPQREQSIRYARAIRGAIHDLRGLRRGYRVRYVALDDSSRAAGGWDPALVAANARRAALAPTTLAYIGEADSGATAVALPILNQSGVLQLTASSTTEGLTRSGAGAGPGAPFQYYPSGRRTLARLVPRDSLQGAVIAALARRDRCRTLAIMDDGSIYGAGLAAIVADESAASRLKVTFGASLDPRADGYAKAVRRIRAACLFYAGDPGAAATKVVTDAARRNPRARVYVPDALVDPTFASHRRGGIGPRLARRVSLVATLRNPVDYPPFGQMILNRIGGGPGDLRATNVAATYAAAELALRCLDSTFRVTGFKPTRVAESRKMMVACALGRRHGSAAVGQYSIDAQGDWSGRSYSLLRIERGRMVFVRALRPQPLRAAPVPVLNPTN